MQTFLMMISGALIGMGMMLVMGFRPGGKRFALLHIKVGWIQAAKAVRMMAEMMARQGNEEQATALTMAALALLNAEHHAAKEEE